MINGSPDGHHGTNTGYLYGCRESCCRTAHADYRRSLRARRYLARVDRFYIDATGTKRRIRALQAMGWRFTDIDDALGNPNVEPGSTRSHQIFKRNRVHIHTAAAVAKVYDELCMTPGPSERTRRRALASGHVSALAWNDIDDPDERPAGPWRPRSNRDDYDEAVVRRILGRDVVPSTWAERVEVVRRWTGEQNELERLTGWNVQRYIVDQAVPA